MRLVKITALATVLITVTALPLPALAFGEISSYQRSATSEMDAYYEQQRQQRELDAMRRQQEDQRVYEESTRQLRASAERYERQRELEDAAAWGTMNQ